MTEITSRLSTALADRYRIERELGGRRYGDRLPRRRPQARAKGRRQELFYRTFDQELVAVPITTDPAFAHGTPRVLFSTAGYEPNRSAEATT